MDKEAADLRKNIARYRRSIAAISDPGAIKALSS